MKLLLDTNVLVDYYAQRAPFADDANKLVAAQMMGDVELWACPHSFPDIGYILRRAISLHELQGAMIASLAFINVCSTGQEEIRAALEADWGDPEDALVFQCAERVKADYLITRDTGGFARAGTGTAVLSPREWLDLMEAEHGIVYEQVEF